MKYRRKIQSTRPNTNAPRRRCLHKHVGHVIYFLDCAIYVRFISYFTLRFATDCSDCTTAFGCNRHKIINYKGLNKYNVHYRKAQNTVI